MSDVSCGQSALEFIKPVDGDMLSNVSGKVCDDALSVTVRVAAEAGRSIMIGGVKATYSPCACGSSAGEYSAQVALDGYRNTVVAVDTDSGASAKMAVYWLKEAAGKYRLSVDDNIWFLQDLARNADRYTSLFQNEYLAMYRRLHDRYGTKVHFNIYMECPEFGGFNLTQMPDKYKGEWMANADWLHLSFHARANLPEKPYLNTDYDTMKRDCVDVVEQIRRFAGEEVMCPVTTVHFGESTVEGVRALRARGIRALMGYLICDESGNGLVSYYLNADQIRNANHYGFWKDHSEDVIFGKVDIVLNSHNPGVVPGLLDEARRTHPEKGFMEFLIHEQYFHSHYEVYLPYYEELLVTAAQWAHDNGYAPAFVSEVVLE